MQFEQGGGTSLVTFRSQHRHVDQDNQDNLCSTPLD